MKGALIILFVITLAPGNAVAGEADVLDVKALKKVAGTDDFEVTVGHADTGWDRYADKWDVMAPDGAVLGTRVLLHPDEDEQPFTRSRTGLRIPAGVDRVTVRAHDKVHGYGGGEQAVVLSR